MSVLQMPLLAVAVVIYNVVAWLVAAPAGALFSMTLPSGALWGVSANDLVVVLALGLLFVELAKSTRTSNTSIVDHGLSVVVFAVCMVEFIAVGFAGTSTFFILLMMTLMDVIAGFMVTITGARRDVNR